MHKHIIPSRRRGHFEYLNWIISENNDIFISIYKLFEGWIGSGIDVQTQKIINKHPPNNIYKHYIRMVLNFYLLIYLHIKIYERIKNMK